ncbi:FecR family protein [Calycomorphotria hydatis]|uniref:Fec operon regulator FecR n=1 Tax=Calycomorphotria hydatis TaxID=2528027 RepID=A0A517TF98_9PLAN|nr:FecR family protein [Calycomorphotria hydatis]QDT67044.1 fec operon regulator FecR [Calycomorphotria hydatis]
MAGQAADMRAEIRQIADAMLNGMADSSMASRLNELIINDLQCRQWYIEHLDLQAALVERSERESAEDCVRQLFIDVENKQKRRSMMVKAIAGGVSALLSLAVAIVVFVSWWNIPAAPVGRLSVMTADVEWESQEYLPGDVLRAGALLILNNGAATLELSNGTVVNLVAPVSALLRHDMHMTLAEGVLAANVPEQAHGFTVQTDDAEIIDLGTEFLVEKISGKGTHLLVREGMVEARLLDEQEQPTRILRLSAGQMMRFAGSDGVVEEEDRTLDWAQTTEKVEQVHGGVRQLTGQARMSVAPPLDLTTGEAPTKGFLLAIREKSAVEVSEKLTLTTRDGPVTLEPGLKIDSYLVHYDASGQTDPRAKGSLAFNKPILAVLDASDQLALTDHIFGLESRVWPTDTGRGYEAEDNLRLSDDRMTLTLHPGVSGVNQMDQCRVLFLHDE